MLPRVERLHGLVAVADHGGLPAGRTSGASTDASGSDGHAG